MLRNSAKPTAEMRSLDSSHSICTEICRSSAGAISAMKCSDIWADSARVSSVELMAHSEPSTSKHPDGNKLQDFADLVLDAGAPAGDAMVYVDGLDTPVAPGSTVGGCLLVNSIKAEVAKRLTEGGQPP